MTDEPAGTTSIASMPAARTVCRECKRFCLVDDLVVAVCATCQWYDSWMPAEGMALATQPRGGRG